MAGNRLAPVLDTLALKRAPRVDFVLGFRVQDRALHLLPKAIGERAEVRRMTPPTLFFFKSRYGALFPSPFYVTRVAVFFMMGLGGPAS